MPSQDTQTKIDTGPATDALEAGRFDFVTAQVAVAVDILLAAPLRMQNLTRLNWSRHFKEPKGPKGPLHLYISKDETKSGKRNLCFELPDEVARSIRWYRTRILPRLDADPRGDLFVKSGGSQRPTDVCSPDHRHEEHVGVHMSPHQFRHFAAGAYLEEHPEDFQSVTDLLGHVWAKTTSIYAGPSSRRVSRVYSSFLLEQRAALQLKRQAGRRRSKCAN
jgi:site-specific recombinase XerC